MRVQQMPLRELFLQKEALPCSSVQGAFAVSQADVQFFFEQIERIASWYEKHEPESLQLTSAEDIDMLEDKPIYMLGQIIRCRNDVVEGYPLLMLVVLYILALTRFCEEKKLTAWTKVLENFIEYSEPPYTVHHMRLTCPLADKLLLESCWDFCKYQIPLNESAIDEQPLCRAISFFVDKMASFSKEHLQAASLALCKGIELIDIHLSATASKNLEAPQDIIERLAFTHRQQSQREAVGQLLLGRYTPAEQYPLLLKWNECIHSYFDHDEAIEDFFFDFLVMKTQSLPDKQHLCQSFRRYMKEEQVTGRLLLNTLVKEAALYRELYFQNSEYTKLNTQLRAIMALGFKECLPVLLLVKDACTVEELTDVAKLLISYVVRHKMVHEGVQQAKNFYYPCLQLIKALREEIVQTRVHGDIKSKVCQHLLELKDYWRCPTNKEFKTAFRCYSEENIPFVTYVLRSIAQYEDPQPEQYLNTRMCYIGSRRQDTVQSFFTRFGNMVLLTEAERHAVEHIHSFEEKRSVFSNNAWSRVRRLSLFAQWDVLTLQDNAEELASLAVKVWAIE